MLQRLPVVVSQVKAGITFENLLNEIRQAIYSLYQATEITKKLNTNIMNSISLIQLINRIDTTFMNSGNSKTSDPCRLLLNLSDKIDSKISAPTWNENFDLPMDHIFYQISRIILSIS